MFAFLANMGLITPFVERSVSDEADRKQNTRLSVYYGWEAVPCPRLCPKALHRLNAGYQLPVANTGNIGG